MSKNAVVPRRGLAQFNENNKLQKKWDNLRSLKSLYVLLVLSHFWGTWRAYFF